MDAPSSSDFSSLTDLLLGGSTIAALVVGAGALVVVAKLLSGGSSTPKRSHEVREKGGDKEQVKRTGVLDPDRFQNFKLIKKEEITHNSKILRFALPRETDVLGLPVGKHMSFRATIDGKEVYRPYTPISSDDDLGHFDLLVKVYVGGKMTEYLDSLEIGDGIDVRGPKGKFDYTPNMKKAIGMIAGGTGITPMLQVIHAVLKNPADKTQLRLIFGNVKEEDILLRDQIEGLARAYPEQFKVYFVLNEAPENWTQGTGFITAEMIKEHLPPPSDDNLITMCGPTPMTVAMKKHLETLRYAEQQLFTF